MPLQFYEKVEILRCADYPDRVGKSGHILGISDIEDGEPLSYGVFFDDVGEVYCFEAADLRSMGEIAARSDFYGDEVIRVRVEDGKGIID